MAELTVLQPNGLYAIFSTIVDDFILTGVTREELIEWRVAEAAEESKLRTQEGIARAHAPRQKYQSCECLQTIYGIHGDAQMQKAKAEINRPLCKCGFASISQCENCDAWFCEDHVGQRGGDRQVEDVGAVAYPALCEACCHRRD